MDPSNKYPHQSCLPRPADSDLQQVLAERDRDGFGAVGDAEFLEDYGELLLGEDAGARHPLLRSADEVLQVSQGRRDAAEVSGGQRIGSVS